MGKKPWTGSLRVQLWRTLNAMIGRERQQGLQDSGVVCYFNVELDIRKCLQPSSLS